MNKFFILILCFFITISCESATEPEGCDGVAGSGLTLDECGICDGDNSTCTDDCGIVNGNNESMDACGVCDEEGAYDSFCDEGEIVLWCECYSIEDTTVLDRDINVECSPFNAKELPNELVQLTNLITIDLENCGLEGSLPLEIGNLTNLEYLNLKSNYNLSGSIPTSIGELVNLTTLYVRGNLSGSIPPEIGNLTQLITLSFYDNNLSGSLPPEIGNLINLEYVTLSNNQLTGQIPSEIGNLTNLSSLFLSDNQLTGEIPPEIGNLTNLGTLWLTNNQLSGEFPAEFLNVVGPYTHIHLQNNNLSGQIPEAFCDNCGLEPVNGGNSCSVKLGGNSFCPPYPDCFENNDNDSYLGTQDTSNCP